MIDPFLAQRGGTEDPETCEHPSVGPTLEHLDDWLCRTCGARPESWTVDENGLDVNGRPVPQALARPARRE